MSFHSIEDIRNGVQGANLRAVQLNTGTPRGSALHMFSNEIVFSAGTLDADVHTWGTVDPKRVSFAVNLNNESTIFSFRSGQEVLPGDIYSFGPGEEFANRSVGKLFYATLALNADELIKLGSNDAVIGDLGCWEHRHWYRSSQEVRTLICKSISGIASRLMRPGITMTPQQIKLLQQELVESILWGIAYDTHKPIERHAYFNATIVRKVVEWMDDQPTGPIQISNICGALHLSRRTLQRAFTETLGMGPARYLMLKRLSTVRSLLRTSDPNTTSVTNVALENGFWELGHFAVLYRRMFGERPSQTLYKRY
ncbi:MAG TPA: helix-turn-helix transcriptional regulator [Chitinophagaceae bacterium]|nr:helix-turn-helix transcriptional regulator [Chitinophagaceae bacterium]